MPHQRENNVALNSGLIRALRSLLPPESVLVDAEDLRPFECDGLAVYRQLPMVVVLPETIEQVQSIMRLCHAQQVPVVARGAGTGLSGGALPLANGVLLSLAKFKNILNIDPHNAMATVQPGVRNLAISEAAAAYGLYYAPDPSSQIACTIGGNVAENSGGVHCLKYGLTVHNILMLKVVTMEGELLTIGAETLDSPGYDLLALMTGSEGMLGVIVEVTVKLLARPERAQVVLAAFDDVVQGRRGGRRDHRRRHHPRRPGDDGQAGDPGGGGFRARGLSARCRGDPAVRTGRHACRSVRIHHGGAQDIDRQRRDRSAHRGRRSRAAAVLEGPQIGLPRGGPHLAGLLLHGRHDTAPPVAACAAPHQRDVGGIRTARSPTCSMPATATCIR